jgi:protein O-GlcNAc transferase
MAIGSGKETYAPLLESGKIRLIGFEPDAAECAKLNETSDVNRRYYPHFVGDGSPATYYETNLTMTGSLFEPNADLLSKFQNLNELTTLVATHEVETIRLDDVDGIDNVDYIKIDVQGAELSVFENGINALAQSMIIHTEVEFVEMYKKQPLFANVDTFLRDQGYQFHTFSNYGSRCFKPFTVGDNINKGINQRLWADAVYVRDFMKFEDLADNKLIKLAVILNDVYQSFDYCYYILAHLDKKNGSSFAADYVGRINNAAE